MAKEIKNIGASVRARLLKLSKVNGQSFDLVLTRFALERLLFRLSQSPHAEHFVLKGAMLMMSWFDDPHRGTRDLDLLGFGNPSEDAMLATFRDILSQDGEDGVVFDLDSLRVNRIREELDYGGLRLRAIASVGGAKINLTIDIGFGDALEPGAEVVVSGHARFPRATTARLCARDGHRREVPGDGCAGPGEQPDEGLLRHLDSEPIVQLR
jgi:hypothetical protein